MRIFGMDVFCYPNILDSESETELYGNCFLNLADSIKCSNKWLLSMSKGEEMSPRGKCSVNKIDIKIEWNLLHRILIPEKEQRL